MNSTQESKLGNFWVFREGRHEVEGRSFLRRLLDALDEISRHPHNPNRVIGALLLAGQLESALADVEHPSLPIVEKTTDLLAESVTGNETRTAEIRQRLADVAAPKMLTISPPEGFAYYALHPSDFARMTESVQIGSEPVAVIGIRSIGTTLSAVVKAAITEKSHAVERITVRPTGHPYNRRTEFSGGQKSWITQRIAQGAQFLVVDEGPGRSGSSFLSVAEALVRLGARSESITLLGSRAVDASELCTENVLRRWPQFRFQSPVTKTYERFKNDFYIGGGDWRSFFILNAEWPACWPQMERLKFLSADRAQLYKFEGFGCYGQSVLDRAKALADSGFGPRAQDAGDGMIRYSVVQGHRPAASQVSSQLLQRIAEYCAFRACEFTCSKVSPAQLGEMARFNLQTEFGSEIEFVPASVDIGRYMLVDGRMQPHEWILSHDGTLIKVDGTTHGDDHFFPGPADIAWDLAGTIVEWKLSQEAADFFLSRFFFASGDDARSRTEAFVLAYAAFQLGNCGMALTTVQNTAEESRLRAARDYYCRVAASRLKRPIEERMVNLIASGIDRPELPVPETPPATGVQERTALHTGPAGFPRPSRQVMY
jgi:hypothetical protein